MPLDFFMSTPGIPGESTDSRHAGKIVLLTCSWSFEKLINPDTGQLASPLLSRYVTINKKLDSASPLLAQAAGTGSPLSGCEILAVNVNPQANVWRLVLSNARVEHYNQSFNGGDLRPTETLVLGYASIQVDVGPSLDGSNRYTFTP